MNIDEQILRIVSEPSFDNFTAYQLAKIFVKKIGEEHVDDYEKYRFVCAQMKLLAKNGVIEIADKEHMLSGIYVKTAAYRISKTTQLESSTIRLKEKHRSYKKQFLIGIGEAEEYKALCQEHPELHKKLQPKYNKVLEQNSKLLGKIKVLESLLNNMDT